MIEHEALLKSLLVERYRPWRPDPQPDLTPAQPARTMGRKKRDSRGAANRQRSRQPQPNEDRRTT
jgi:hypothetical protein